MLSHCAISDGETHEGPEAGRWDLGEIVEYLPRDLALVTFSFLGCADLLEIASITCHCWNELSRDRCLWKHLDFTVPAVPTVPSVLADPTTPAMPAASSISNGAGERGGAGSATSAALSNAGGVVPRVAIARANFMNHGLKARGTEGSCFHVRQRSTGLRFAMKRARVYPNGEVGGGRH